jgi:hypothetical protein
MLGPFDYALWIIGFLLEIGVVVCAVYRKTFLRYLPLNLYMLGAALVTVGQYIFIQTVGLASKAYFDYYYYSDSLLTILLFWVVMHFYQQIFIEMGVRRQIRMAAMLLLAATAIFSYAVVHQNRSHLTTKFVVEMGQNLYFVGVVLTYLLWGAILKLRETRTRLIQLVLALGVYFSATAGTYALRNLFPALQEHFLHWIPPVVGLWLPMAWAYTLAMVTEEERLATARLAVKTR